MFEDHQLVKQARQFGRASSVEQSAPHTNPEFVAILPVFHIPECDKIPLKMAMHMAYIEGWNEKQNEWQSEYYEINGNHA